MSNNYQEIRIEPALETWPGRLKVAELDNGRLNDLRIAAKSRLIDAAQQFIIRLNTIADDADLKTSSRPVLTGDPQSQPIVMTGHQPVIFHSGLSFKYDVTEQFAADNNAICVAITIDTDRGDAGQFSHPRTDAKSASGLPSLAIDSLADSHSLYSKGKLKSAVQLKAVADDVSRQLKELGQDDAAAAVDFPLAALVQLRSATSSVMEANLILRSLMGSGGRMLELPLSAVASFPESLTFTADILKQPRRFAAAYNSALDVYRDENNIRNAANPFPNLKIGDHECELPFWVINHDNGSRQALEVRVDGNVTHLMVGSTTIDTLTGNITPESLEPMLLQNLQLVPRGALITAFLRLLFADLFVHGTGGARYDNFTDEFIRSWWNVEPTPFTMATASRYLFEDRRAEIRRLEEIQDSLRDLQFNPQRHFGENVFSSDTESTLKDLVRKKEAAIEQLSAARAEGTSARDVGTEIQRLTGEIKAAVDGEFESELAGLHQLSPEHLDAINCRTYPWFLFGQ